MRVIPREAKKVITYSTQIRNLKKKNFSPFQKAVLVGCLLGDGNAEISWEGKNYRLKIEHSVKQKDFVFWKYEIFKDFVLTEPKFCSRNKSIAFRTISHPDITNFGEKFYRTGKKFLPRDLEAYFIDPKVIAVWFMDDGNVIKRNGKVYGYYLNSQSFTREENLFLKSLLEKIYGIKFSLEINHGRYRLRIMREKEREKFEEIIKPHIISSMRYKLG